LGRVCSSSSKETSRLSAPRANKSRAHSSWIAVYAHGVGPNTVQGIILNGCGHGLALFYDLQPPMTTYCLNLPHRKSFQHYIFVGLLLSQVFVVPELSDIIIPSLCARQGGFLHAHNTCRNKRQILHEFQHGDVFGEISVFMSIPRTASIVAIVSKLLWVTASSFGNLLFFLEAMVCHHVMYVLLLVRCIWPTRYLCVCAFISTQEKFGG
jgi:hypothetical protein